MKLKSILSTILMTLVVLQTSIPVSADSYYGSKSNTGGDTQIVEEDNPSTYTIFGDDDAVSITGSQLQQFPYKSVAKLKITYEGGYQEGTAFRYQTGVLATAGHCLNHPKYGKAKSITIVFPSLTLYTTNNDATYNVPPQYSSTHDWRYDYGVIKLNTNSANYTKLKNSNVGWVGIDAAEATKTNVGSNVKIMGYRANSSTLKYMQSPITAKTTVDFGFKHDLLGGQSGAPVIQSVSPGYVIGIFNYGANGGNYLPNGSSENNTCARITSAIESYFYSFA